MNPGAIGVDDLAAAIAALTPWWIAGSASGGAWPHAHEAAAEPALAGLALRSQANAIEAIAHVRDLRRFLNPAFARIVELAADLDDPATGLEARSQALAPAALAERLVPDGSGVDVTPAERLIALGLHGPCAPRDPDGAYAAAVIEGWRRRQLVDVHAAMVDQLLTGARVPVIIESLEVGVERLRAAA